jgi:hypothetical protein
MEENTQTVEAMEQQAPVSAPAESTSSFSFISDEEVAQINQPQQNGQPTQEVPQGFEQETPVEQVGYQPEAQQRYAPEEIEDAVFEFLSGLGEMSAPLTTYKCNSRSRESSMKEFL